MFDFASIRNLIQKPKGRTAAEIRAAVADVELALKGHETKAGQLEERRKGVLLSGTDAEIEAIDGQIKSENREVERRYAAIAELNRLLEAAEATEKANAIEARHAAAVETQADVMRSYIELDAAAQRVCELLATIERGEREIQAAAVFMRAEGRPDLEAASPINLLAVHLGRDAGGLPQIGNWVLHGYYPRPYVHPDGFLLSRMREILPGRQRKAAA